MNTPAAINKQENGQVRLSSCAVLHTSETSHGQW